MVGRDQRRTEAAMSFSRNTPPGTLKLKPRDRIIAPAKWITKNDRKRRPIDGPGSTEQKGRPLILDTSRFLPSSPPTEIACSRYCDCRIVTARDLSHPFSQ